MTGTITQHAPRGHTCSPGWESRPGNLPTGESCDFMHQMFCRPGDVWTCECGKQWVASDARSNYATVGQCTSNAVEWSTIKVKAPRWWRR